MTVPVQSTPQPVSSALDSDLCGVFVVDADGKVVASNASARALWSTATRPLISLPLAALFSSTSVSPEPGEGEVAEQWRQLKSDAMDRWTLRQARRLDDAPTGEVRLRLERASGGAGSYIATVLSVQR
jgi:PAS domain-containing protein